MLSDKRIWVSALVALLGVGAALWLLKPDLFGRNSSLNPAQLERSDAAGLPPRFQILIRQFSGSEKDTGQKVYLAMALSFRGSSFASSQIEALDPSSKQWLKYANTYADYLMSRAQAFEGNLTEAELTWVTRNYPDSVFRKVGGLDTRYLNGGRIGPCTLANLARMRSLIPGAVFQKWALPLVMLVFQRESSQSRSYFQSLAQLRRRQLKSPSVGDELVTYYETMSKFEPRYLEDFPEVARERQEAGLSVDQAEAVAAHIRSEIGPKRFQLYLRQVTVTALACTSPLNWDSVSQWIEQH